MARDAQFDKMTVRQAKAIVAEEHLRFGDARHIFAVNLLEKAAEVESLSEAADVEIEIECPDCSGTGNCDCHCGDSHDCGMCAGKGKRTKSDEDDDDDDDDENNVPDVDHLTLAELRKLIERAIPEHA